MAGSAHEPTRVSLAVGKVELLGIAGLLKGRDFSRRPWSKAAFVCIYALVDGEGFVRHLGRTSQRPFERMAWHRTQPGGEEMHGWGCEWLTYATPEHSRNVLASWAYAAEMKAGKEGMRHITTDVEEPGSRSLMSRRVPISEVRWPKVRLA